MTVDYIVASLPALAFGEKAPISWERFREAVGDDALVARLERRFADLEVQLRNAAAAARGGADDARPADGCSLYWRDRVAACFQERDVAKRQDLIDRAWWDAAGELASPADPLGAGALAAYAVRLKSALRRDRADAAAGNAAFDAIADAATPGFGQNREQKI